MADKANDATRERKGSSKLHSAEEFSNYVHAVTIPMKIVMAAIVVFFVGAIAYCIVGTVPVHITSAAVSKDECVCYIKAVYRNDVQPGDEVKIDGKSYSLASIASEAVPVDETLDATARQKGGLSLGDYVFVATVDGDVPTGVYKATITNDYLNPLQALLFS